MDLQIHSAQKLSWRDSLGLWALLVIAIGGAGMLLLLSSIREYGLQSWYRLPYWFGGLMALAALISYSFFFPRIKMTWIRNGMLSLRHHRGIRLVERHEMPLTEVKDVSIRDQKLFLQTDRGQICLSVRSVKDASRLETARSEFLGFLQAT